MGITIPCMVRCQFRGVQISDRVWSAAGKAVFAELDFMQEDADEAWIIEG
jgi:hypothetical protein